MPKFSGGPLGQAAALALGLSALATRAQADQFIAVDATYTHSNDTTDDSHYRVPPKSGSPSDWTKPVNYAEGSVYVELEVKTKPSTANTKFQICFEGQPTYACTDQSEIYTKPGTYRWVTPFSKFYQGNGKIIDWSKPVGKIALILKDDKNGKPAIENVGDATSKKFMPTDLRVVVAVLTKGATYQAPSSGGKPDAGAPDAGPSGTKDASASTDDDAGDASEEDAATDDEPTRDASAPERRDGSTRPIGDASAISGKDASANTDEDKDPAKTSSSDSGCALATGSNGAGLWLASLALLAWRRRRRKA